MNRTSNNLAHPGTYVRQEVIPKGVTVTKAADLLGVGRPALSNLLNGKASISPEMALRLERTFGADHAELLDLQARFDRREDALRRPIIAGVHAPLLVSINAQDIDNWADRIVARSELPALLRRLIQSTGRDLACIDFPAYDNAERPGWDGVVETPTPTPWIPSGKSGWEFGCSQNRRTKAEHDYEARVRSEPTKERRERSFVFVTPRKWQGKDKWAVEKAKFGDWKDVRVYDASDLEQWLEQSAPTQIWFAERLGKPVSGYRSLERCWSEWAEACEPVLSPMLFDSIVQDSSTNFERWLEEPPEQPFIVAADSRGEALAFLSCLVGKVRFDADQPNAGAVVFDTPEAMQRFNASAAAPRIAVVYKPEVEKKIGGLFRRCHCIIVRPGNDVNANPDIRLGILVREDFANALKAMELPKGRIERLANESARSPTILRRCLSKIPAIREPAWAGDAETARKLLPAALVGAWHNASSADCEIVGLLANSDDDNNVESGIAELLALEDAPVWSVGEYRGVVSRTDALYGISKFITKRNLDDFFFVAECVLSEKDPAIDLPNSERWLANLYGKVRDHSDALRCGIRETLILLAVFGGELFGQRPGVDVNAQVADLIRKLLTPLDHEKIMSQKSDLPDYAEAGPEVFLSLIESDLRQATPIVRELMPPAGNSPFDSPSRTNLLWALENLAWTPSLFPRVVSVLAKLCAMDDKDSRDNWLNRPENTLKSIFRSWLPQTAASLDERVRTFEKLCHDYPALGWCVCISQLNWRRSTAIPNHRPRWRDDARNADRELIKNDEHRDFVLKAIDVALNWLCHDENTLADLIKLFDNLPEKDQLRLWNLIDKWADSTSSDNTKAYLRQRIHGYVCRSYRKNGRINHAQLVNTVSEKLLPKDPVTRCAWLFKPHWVELPTEDAESMAFDFKKNNQRLLDFRLEALREVWEMRGFQGVVALLDRGDETSCRIGDLIAKILAEDMDTMGFVEPCLRAATGVDAYRYKSCLAGFLWNAESEYIAALVEELKHKPDTLLTLLLCLPYGKATWRWLNDKAETFCNAYWENVEPRILSGRHAEEEVNRTIDELLTVNRVGTVFMSVGMMWDKVETSRLKKLLSTLITDTSEEIPQNSMTAHYVSMAFDELDKRSGILIDEKAGLEFAYLPLLDQSEHGIPNLEELIAKSPDFYFQAIRCLYERADGTEDWSELGFDDRKQYERAMSNFDTLLHQVRRMPGADAQGEINPIALNDWICQVRRLCERYDRVDMGDLKIGEFLARAQANNDGVWPCRPVCEALEWMASDMVGHGFEIGTRNSRGAQIREEGGNQERAMAARYRGWARELVHEFPYVGSVLERIAASYEDEAKWWDDRENVSKWIPYK